MTQARKNMGIFRLVMFQYPSRQVVRMRWRSSRPAQATTAFKLDGPRSCHARVQDSKDKHLRINSNQYARDSVRDEPMTGEQSEEVAAQREGAAHGRLREQSYAHVMKSIDNYATCVYTFANRPTTLLRINFSGTAPAASWHLRVFLLRDINAKFTIIMFANQIISLAYIQNGC